MHARGDHLHLPRPHVEPEPGEEQLPGVVGRQNEQLLALDQRPWRFHLQSHTNIGSNAHFFWQWSNMVREATHERLKEAPVAKKAPTRPFYPEVVHPQPA